MFYAGICQFTTSQQENHTGFCAAGPRLRRGAGALCLVSQLRKPFGPASLRLRSCSVCFGAACGVSLRPSEPFGLLGLRRTRKAVSPSMFTVADNHKPGYSNQGRMYHCGRAIYRALLIIAPGMEAVMRGWHRFKHKIITPSFVLFADNGIDHPCHSYGYAFGWPALFLTKITSTFPILYA